MKPAAKVVLTILFAHLCAAGVAAQEAAPAEAPAGWTSFAPAGEPFAALLPGEPSVRPHQFELGGAAVTGRLYWFSGDDRNVYQIWSLDNPRPADPKDPLAFSRHLDECAELAWSFLVEPAARRARGRRSHEHYMNYGREAGGPYHLREYALALGAARGAVSIFSDGERIFFAAAYGRLRDDPNVKRFLDSFGVKPPGGNDVQTRRSRAFPEGGVVVGPPRVVGPGRGGYDPTGVGDGSPRPGETDDARPLGSREVARKAVIRHKPEPGYTEPARKFGVTGTVRLRAVLGADGNVNGITVVTRLPHGLTERAVAAARGMRFDPAEKDGRAVSQYVVIEYNFNIY